MDVVIIVNRTPPNICSWINYGDVGKICTNRAQASNRRCIQHSIYTLFYNHWFYGEELIRGKLHRFGSTEFNVHRRFDSAL
jgi:hypothetical protein